MILMHPAEMRRHTKVDALNEKEIDAYINKIKKNCRHD